MLVTRFKCKSTVLCVALLVMFAVLVWPVHADQASAQTEIASAKAKLIECYSAAKAAEASGANISQLTNTLNNAGLMFSQAELAFSGGDFESAQNFAAQTRSALSAFVDTANSLQAAAAQERDQDFLVNFVGSIAGTAAVLVGSFGAWILLKKKYGNEGGALS